MVVDVNTFDGSFRFGTLHLLFHINPNQFEPTRTPRSSSSTAEIRKRAVKKLSWNPTLPQFSPFVKRQRARMPVWFLRSTQLKILSSARFFRLEPQWSPQNRPFVDGSKPAINLSS
jgi:hypothetical protein